MARGGFNPMGGGNMQQLMRQAQKMQQDLQKKQAELNESTFTAQAGGGMVTVTVYGTKELKSIELKPEIVDPDDIEMLQDLIVAGVNAAIKEASDTMEREIGKLTGGMNLGF
ncbi:MAG: YbaB/EbfC family nucleoid-associated protein [Clostridia bacterium]|nr:YbaB/EbfC family nucleoid-associated protein [Clostridia bacterium]